MKNLVHLTLLFSVVLISACTSTPFIPDKERVAVKNEAPDEDCVKVGPVRGAVISAKGTIEEATEDMRRDAASKGANFVRFEQASETGTAVTGTAFKCP
jgi:hypothetical protein